MNVALIPVRGGSKSILKKNIKPLFGKPLVYWTVKAACESINIDRVFVSTDDDEIRMVVETFGFDKVTVVGRSPETATDTASTESVMMEFAQQQDFDQIVLLQATSPLTTAKDIDMGFALMARPDTDSVASVVRIKRFFWDVDECGCGRSLNYDYRSRPRRQDFPGILTENGAIYITKKKDLLQNQNRIGGRIRLLEMRAETYFEIDEPDDFVIIESLMRNIVDHYHL